MRQLVIFASFLIGCSVASKLLPILIWHSVGETCCEGEIKLYGKILKSLLGEKVYIKSVRIGNTTNQDKVLSIFEHPFEQIKQVCDEIKNDANFKYGYNAIGLSQGGLLVRGLLQECDGPPMRNLISLGGPQQGVFDYPHCKETFGPLCSTVQFTIKQIVYSE